MLHLNIKRSTRTVPVRPGAFFETLFMDEKQSVRIHRRSMGDGSPASTSLKEARAPSPCFTRASQ
ncbi:hypothetical protein [Rossellomorea aquimaris]|uniref:hypothetical protein n=1 Tax=Rossellomorea aquimaris TaxID=189382 RepID=UPI002493E690|nr:hypothetical protein [Rossellomorea aquimaris]